MSQWWLFSIFFAGRLRVPKKVTRFVVHCFSFKKLTNIAWLAALSRRSLYYIYKRCALSVAWDIPTHQNAMSWTTGKNYPIIIQISQLSFKSGDKKKSIKKLPQFNYVVIQHLWHINWGLSKKDPNWLTVRVRATNFSLANVTIPSNLIECLLKHSLGLLPLVLSHVAGRLPIEKQQRRGVLVWHLLENVVGVLQFLSTLEPRAEGHQQCAGTKCERIQQMNSQ